MAKVTTTYNLAVSNPVLCEEWHPTKNVDLTPNNVLPGSHEKVWWICRKCKYEWQADICGRNSRGRGCKKCYLNRHKKN